MALLHGGDDFLEADYSSAENSTAEFVGHGGNDNGRTVPISRSGVNRPAIIAINYPALHLMPVPFAKKRWLIAQANGCGLD
jgi:hypothetical protein